MQKEKRPMIEVSDVGIRLRLGREKAGTLKDMFFDRARGKTIQRPDYFWALRHINFSVMPGDRMAIFGLNGSGKSTLLKIIADVYLPTEGKVRKQGTLAPLLELGAGFSLDYTAEENIFLYGAILGYPHSFLREKKEEIIAFAELQDFVDVPLRNYSSGMKSRLGFSICTAVNPDILILDEVLAVGDAKFKAKSEKKLLDMMDENTIVLFVSHSLEQAKRICNRGLILQKGSMLACGEIEEIANQYEALTKA